MKLYINPDTWVKSQQQDKSKAT